MQNQILDIPAPAGPTLGDLREARYALATEIRQLIDQFQHKFSVVVQRVEVFQARRVDGTATLARVDVEIEV